MRRFALAVIVGLLVFSASGAVTLVVPETCELFERAGEEDRDCAPTCVTCGCCAQSTEPVALVVVDTPDHLVAELTFVLPRFLEAAPNEVLHVPRPLTS